MASKQAHKDNARKRVGVLTLIDPESQKMVWIYPNDDLPDWAPEDLNPHVFADDDDPAYAEPELESMSVKELLTKANKAGIEVMSTRKKDIIAALRAEDGTSADDD